MKQYLIVIFISLIGYSYGQDIKRERPREWDNLVFGGAFIDRFLPIPPIGELTHDTWGCDAVKPRYVENGIEDPAWSYWGGNIVRGDDSLYHLFVCRWPENAEKGHMAWPSSEVVHAVSSNRMGPYKVKGEAIGKGHNPELFRLKDGRYVIYVIDGYYISNSLNGPWKKGKFQFDPRDRKIIEGLSNLSFAQREDGSFLMVCRGGGIWVSQTGLSPWKQVTNKSVYPPYNGRYEDPVIWRTNIQYHMIVNDWYGRIAYYLRSGDGFNWIVEPGEAYKPGIARYEDGTLEDWYKYERIKVLQDEIGRPVQANFAVIDSSKWHDFPNDRHSSKNICIPLAVEKQLLVLNTKKITAKTKSIRLKIFAEPDFNPQTDVDFASLRLGSSEEVNFGRGCTVVRTENEGDNMVLEFDAKGFGLTKNESAAKLIGKTNNGNLLFGYARLPEVEYGRAVLSCLNPKILTSELMLEVENFGLSPSRKSLVCVELTEGSCAPIVLEGVLPKIMPYQKEVIHLKTKAGISENRQYHVKVFLKNQPDAMPLWDCKIEN